MRDIARRTIAPFLGGGGVRRGFQLVGKEDRKPYRFDVYAVAGRSNAGQERAPRDKGRYYEYHASRGHNTAECSMLKRGIAREGLKGNLVDIARNLKSCNEIRAAVEQQPQENND